MMAVTTFSTVAAEIDFSDSILASQVRSGMSQIAELLNAELSDGDEVLRGLVSAQPLTCRRMVRSLITVIGAHTGADPTAWEVTAAGGAVEMIYLATVHHRAVASAQHTPAQRWANDIAILAGDYLLARASRLLARLGPTAVNLIAGTFAHMVTGQMRADRRAGQCLRAMREMTGSLNAAAAHLGALFSGVGNSDVRRVSHLGETIGIALQICDDIAAITVRGDVVDVTQWRYTLPVLYALREPGKQANQLRGLMSVARSTEDADAARGEEAASLLHASGAMIRAAEAVADCVERARRDLATLPDTGGRRALSAVADHLAARQREILEGSSP